jgi:class 3 adenylate cyclase
MSLSASEREQVVALVEYSLDEAEKTWVDHGYVFESFSILARDDATIAKAEIVPSKIPDHPNVSSDFPTTGEFICLVADMRDSKGHLLNAISGVKDGVSQMKRIYFEMAALLPALEITIGFQSGGVTEYLGDGVLALFVVNPNEREAAVRSSYAASKNCVGDTRDIVNEALRARYNLPELCLGVGLAYSSAIIQLVGVPNNRHPKAIGPCVYYASKLSGGVNQIHVHENIKLIWPTSKGGTLMFTPKVLRGTDGFLVG